MQFQTSLSLLVIFITHLNFTKCSRFQRYKARSIPRLAQNIEEFEKCPYNICEHVTDYPYLLIEQLVKNSTAIHVLFGNLFNAKFDNVEISNRNGEDENETKEPFCNVQTKSYTPQVMKNIQNHWQYVVNLKDYNQYFTVDTCRETNGTQRNFCQLSDGNCVQKYQEIPLLIFDGGKLAYDRFKFPSSCECYCNS